MNKIPSRNPLALLAGLAMAATVPIAAQAGDGGYIGAEAGANFVNSTDSLVRGTPILNSSFDTGFLFGLSTGYKFTNGWRPELALDYRRNSVSSVSSAGVEGSSPAGRVDAYTLMGNLWYDFNLGSGSRVHPYLGGGVGPARIGIRNLSAQGVTDIIDAYRTVLGYQGGAGVGLDLTDHLTASLDYRYLETGRANFGLLPAAGALVGSDTAASRYRAQSAMLSLRYLFGIPKEAPAPVVAPAPVAEVAPPPPPPPPPPVDSDGDGVPDNLDKCPGTPAGFKVDADGCIIAQTLVIRAVNFKTNSDELTDAAKQTLDPIAAALVSQPSLNVEIDGYTDSVGSPAYNRKLSERRANSVKGYLVSKGANAAGLTARGFGPANPIADNKTEDGRTQNRRVEFVVTNQPVGTKVETQGSTEASQEAAKGAKPAKSGKKK